MPELAALRQLLGASSSQQLWVDRGASLTTLIDMLRAASPMPIEVGTELEASGLLDIVKISWPQAQSLSAWIETNLQYLGLSWRVENGVLYVHAL